MDYNTFLTIMVVGIMGAGLVHSAWLWLGATRPAFTSIIEDGNLVSIPFRVFGVMFAAPLILSGAALNHLNYGWRYAGLTLMGLVAASLWCFMSGIVIIVGLDALMYASN